MAKLQILAGATSQSLNVFVQDSTSATGAGLAAVAPAGGALLSGTKLYYSFTGTSASAGVAVALSVLAAVNSAWSSAGIVTLDGTNMIGWVRIDIPNAALAAASGRVVSFLLWGGTNMAPVPFEIELTATNNQSATAFITGVNSLAPPTNWNLESIDASGRLDVIKIAGTTQTARDIGASVLLSSGTGTGQVKLSSGYVAPNWGDVGNPTTTVGLTNTTVGIVTLVTTLTTYTGNTVQTGDSFARIGVAGAGLTNIDLPNQTMDIVGNITGNLSGSVGSVTGQLTAAQIATGVWQDTTAGDFTTASSIGKSLYTGGVVPGGTNGLFIAGTNAATTITTSLTTTFTGNLTGSVASVVGAVGSVTGLTASNLDATISSRMATYTQPAGFLAATFPTTVASTTNITAGVITTVTNLTNAPTVGDLTAAMKASVNVEVLDVLTVDTFAEPSAPPAATATLKNKIGWITALSRNKITQSTTTQTLRNDADSGNIGTAAVSDVASIFTRAEWA